MTETRTSQEAQEPACTLDEHCQAHPEDDCPDPQDWTRAHIEEWAAQSDD